MADISATASTQAISYQEFSLNAPEFNEKQSFVFEEALAAQRERNEFLKESVIFF